MRNRVLILVILGVFVAVPGAILAFHTAPAPAHVNPGVQRLLDYIDEHGPAGADCVAAGRIVTCTTHGRDEFGALTRALYNAPAPGKLRGARRCHRVLRGQQGAERLLLVASAEHRLDPRPSRGNRATNASTPAARSASIHSVCSRLTRPRSALISIAIARAPRTAKMSGQPATVPIELR